MSDHDAVERKLNDATMHMHGGQLTRAIREAREAIDLMERIEDRERAAEEDDPMSEVVS